MSPEQREESLKFRRVLRRPWHRPPHFSTSGIFLLSAACFEHKPHIAFSAERLNEFAQQLFAVADASAKRIHAWCVLPNHYHILVEVESLRSLLKKLGQMHGRTSYIWNQEEQTKWRQVWHSASDRRMRSKSHFWATINYVHHNAVKHGYVDRWQDWAWSSAIDFLEEVGEQDARHIWNEFPIDRYGEGWDD